NAVTDLLTGIYNRNGFNLYAEEIFRTAKSGGKKFTVILGDMNNLKYINDTFGHVEGDFAIKSAAEAFKNACKENMYCFRIGGDEYVIVSSDIETEEEIDQIKKSANDYLKKINDSANKPYSINISIGVFSDTVENYDSSENPFTIADERMFEAKEKFKREEGFDYRKMRSAN
ncbi:MAG: GGDEF domain-containing protein, partial [Oscillospiraceae bacterium]|nr:GGDEF domain-containing protein [Oscillospiraceae bacterium]